MHLKNLFIKSLLCYAPESCSGGYVDIQKAVLVGYGAASAHPHMQEAEAGTHTVQAMQGDPAYLEKLLKRDLGASYVPPTLQDT